MCALSVLRAALFYRFGVGGWETWMMGGGILIVCAALLRQWAHYELTREQIAVRNGYTGHAIDSIPLTDIREVTVRQGMVADFFGIGTVLVHARSSDRLLSLRGVNDPDAVRVRIETLASKRNGATRQPPANF